jgi:predicted O-methyltransferase YrrM
VENYETSIAQDETEIQAFTDLLRREGVRSYLEIGSKFGGSLWVVGKSLPYGSRIVSVDLPAGTKAWAQSQVSLANCVNKLNLSGRDAHLIWGNSTSPDVIEQVRALGPYDCILIDADHRLPGLTQDWLNYGPMGRMIAFHDISWRRQPEWKGVRIDVPQFWDALKGDYRHEEFRFCPTRKNNGIGVLWREPAEAEFDSL